MDIKTQHAQWDEYGLIMKTFSREGGYKKTGKTGGWVGGWVGTAQKLKKWNPAAD